MHVHDRVEAVAARHGDALAVACGDERLTYAELERRARHVAAQLQAHGVGPEVVVGVAMKRSIDWVVALLAVLKAGGAYLPLDPAMPAERLAYMSTDCGVQLVLTAQRLAELEAASGRELAPPRMDVRHLAYVIYTSGSTGRPKGVQVEHGSFARMVETYIARFGYAPAERASQVASAAFDASVAEVWPALAAGAALVIATDDVVLSPEVLWRWLAEHAITICFVPTPIAEALMDLPVPITALRVLKTAGDRLRRMPAWPFTVYNLYGPTEANVGATAFALDGRDGPPPIGRPFDHVHGYVLDDDLQPVPAGVPGELYLGGGGVTRGYRGRAGLTAERYLPDPFATVAGARMYRTGDIVRWTDDGQLAFIGRRDDQVKVRGYRIELGEIEHVLAEHPKVSQCAVVACGSERGEKQLVAHVRTTDGERLPVVELKQFCATRLPAYMIPKRFVFHAALPHNASGKIDRQKLANADDGHPVERGQ